MPCIDDVRRVLLASLAGLAIAGCSADRPAPGEAASRAAPATATPAGPKVAAAPASADRARSLPAPATRRTWAEVRKQAAERLVAANPDITYMGRVPEALLAIPVLEIELNRDGSVRKIEILREPRQAKDTMKIAVEAIHRAAPYGDISHLPRPWRFTETFLFDDDRRFKPRTLD